MSSNRPRLVLIGPPASGKSRIGKAVASLLGEPFTDTDKLIVSQHGPIPEIFSTHGEPWFRLREREAVVTSLTQPGVLSLGGGSIINPDTRADLKSLPVVLLDISEEAVAHRVTDSPKRPLLTGVESWKKLVAERTPWYEECATIRFDVSHRQAEDVAAEIVTWLRGVESSEH